MRTVFHIGYHKTGTKLLQTQVFPRLRSCTVVSPVTPSFSEFLPLAMRLCEGEYGDVDRVAFRGVLDQCRRPDETLLISFEDFTARDADGRTPARLERSVEGAHVLICVREQRSIALSTYSQSLRGLGTLTFRGWLDWLASHQAEFRYDELVGRYQRIFGAHRIHVLAYEQLVSSPHRFVDHVREVIDPGAPPVEGGAVLPVVNRGMTRPARDAVLVANRLLVRGTSLEARFRIGPDPAAVATTLERVCARLFPNAADGLRPRDRELADRFAAGFAASNARLEHLTGLPLRQLGYVVADHDVAGT